MHPIPLTASNIRPRRAVSALHYGVAHHDVATILCASSPQGLCAVLLGPSRNAVIRLMYERFAPAPCVESGPGARAALTCVGQLLDGTMPHAIPPLHLIGTPFECLVWRALMAIPRGQSVTYGALAASVGRPHAARAVGAACGRNNLAIVVPCHRAGYAHNRAVQYRWGPHIKEQLLSAEALPP